MGFIESDERRALRDAVRALGRKYDYREYVLPRARSNEPLTELWEEAARLGFVGVNIPAEFGGGGAGIYELALVQEELAGQGCGLTMLVVTPAICGSIIARHGTPEQKSSWLPQFAAGSALMSFAITEPEAGSNAHRLTTTARRAGSDWILTGQKVFISGVDQADAVLVVGRTENHRTGKLQPALFLVPTDAPGFTKTPQDMDIVLPEKQFTLFFDEVRLPAEALIGEDEDTALLQLFTGLNPERILGAATCVGNARYALDRAVDYAKTRSVWKTPIGAHQGIAHPLAQVKIETELAALMMQNAAIRLDSGDDSGAAEAANIAKYAAAEASIRAADQALQTFGGSGFTAETGMASQLAAVRALRVAPVTREMILNYVAHHSLGLPRSY